jgi:hypothetical protein
VKAQTSPCLRDIQNIQTPHDSGPDAHGDVYNGTRTGVGRDPHRLSTQFRLPTQNSVSPLQPPGNLDSIEALQEDLRDARDDLLGSRFRLRTKRQELHVVREKAVISIGAAFDNMRRHFLVKGLDVPRDLESGWVEVDAMRDTLGAKEVAYEQAEKDYDLEEWHYTQMENKFIDSLSLGSSVPVSIEPPTDVTGDWTGHSFGSSDVLATPSLLGELEVRPHLLDDATIEEPLRPQRQNASQHEHPALTRIASNLDKSSRHTAEGLPDIKTTVPLSTQHFVHNNKLSGHTSNTDIRNNSLQSRQYLNTWMLEVLKASTLQKKWLQSLVPKGSANEDEWIAIITRYWTSDNEEDLIFHTGDTVVSDMAVSNACSSKAWQNLSDSSELDDSGTELSSDGLFLPDGRVGDIMASAKNPAEIKPCDLLDSPRRFTPQTSPLISNSSSSLPAVMSETFTAPDFQSRPVSGKETPQIEPSEDTALCSTLNRDSSILPTPTWPTTTPDVSGTSAMGCSSIFNAYSENPPDNYAYDGRRLEHKTANFRVLAFFSGTRKFDRHHIIRSVFDRRGK